MADRPNLLFVFGDQWRAQACGYAGNPAVRTPHLDAFSAESLDLCNAVSGWPVCSPYRASLLTGQYPLRHGMIVNDQSIRGDPVSFAQALDAAGYHTGYIGKWHIDGQGRRAWVPPERRLGFRWWRGYECNHDYHESWYYADGPEPRRWDGYDAAAQTETACAYLAEHRDEPFALFLSWGPPHNPYQTAPEAFRRLYDDPGSVPLRPNVPPAVAAQAREDLAGYYAHCSALDACFGRLLAALEEHGLAGNTVVVFTSDHGDMLGSHGLWRKQWPYEESIRVPFLLRWPAGLGGQGRRLEVPLNSLDVMPSLLGLLGVEIPATVQGADLSAVLRGEAAAAPEAAALLACFRPFHEITYASGAQDYRGVRTARYTYVRGHAGPWLLFDNRQDPYQLENLAASAAHRGLVAELDALLQRRLAAVDDAFEPGEALLQAYGVPLDEDGDVAIAW
jgi:arylsulfatase A-like enzyme